MVDVADRQGQEIGPSALDALWLVLTVVNTALAWWLVRDKVLKADWFGVLNGKIAPWLASSVFVAGYTCLTREILSFSRSRIFRVVQIVLFVPLFFLQVPFVTVRAQITPPNAQLWIDGRRATRPRAQWRKDQYVHEIPLVMRPHRLELKPPDYWESNPVLPQEIELGWRDMLVAMWSGEEFHWSVVWPVTLNAACPPKRIVVVRQNGDAFDDNYLTTWAVEQQSWPVAASAPYDPANGQARGG